MARFPINRPTGTGSIEDGTVEFPSWPEALSPQHLAEPSDTTAHECPNPPAMPTAWKGLEVPTSVGKVWGSGLLLPSWPSRFPPQHHCVPSVRRPQV